MRSCERGGRNRHAAAKCTSRGGTDAAMGCVVGGWEGWKSTRGGGGREGEDRNESERRRSRKTEGKTRTRVSWDGNDGWIRARRNQKTNARGDAPVADA